MATHGTLAVMVRPYRRGCTYGCTRRRNSWIVYNKEGCMVRAGLGQHAPGGAAGHACVTGWSWTTPFAW